MRTLIVGIISVLATQGGHVAGAELDLRKAVVVTMPHRSTQEAKAVGMLVDEVHKRTSVRWPIATDWPPESVPVIAIAREADLTAFAGRYLQKPILPNSGAGPEGFRIDIVRRPTPVVLVIGNDARGVLFGIGRLLREMSMARGRVSLAEGFNVVTSPKFPLRGHQLGYRPKTNSYDGWDLAIWEQYIRDLAVFGTNAVELIPPRSDDAADSPHFPLPPLEMMTGMSKLLDDYGLDVWIWYPAMDRDYGDAKTVESALAEWGQVFEKLPRVDAVFVPGGDPGHTQPRALCNLLEKETAVLHRSHPKAQMWVSPQGFTQEWLDQFIEILEKEQPAWLSGIVFGPQVRVSLPRLRALVPRRYPIRRYPDITHSVQCQYPVADWDVAFAITEAREVINPRPLAEAHICRFYQNDAVGFITYSEGCNDDVNKIVWSSLGWDPKASVLEILREYSRYFIGERYRDDFAQGLLALERNWQGPLLTNESVYTTLEQFRAMEKSATPQEKQNWRFQQALYRAYYDAYLRRRLIYETELEEEANEKLRAAKHIGTLAALGQAEAILDRAETAKPAAEWRARVFELAEALFQSIRMQLSVERYQAISVDRGANLDTIDVPLNDRVWLKQRFAELRLLGEADRQKGIDSILHWGDPGPGGFYDDLGNLTRQPHLLRGLGFAQDPGCFQSPRIGFAYAPGRRLSWITHAESLYDAPLQMRYSGLDRNAEYKLRVIYAGDSTRSHIRLVANDGIEIHPLIQKERPVRPVEFDIPRTATAAGSLTLTWTVEPGRGGNGRGCQVAEVWLIKK